MVERSDFRRGLYARYASTFKSVHPEQDPAALASYWGWCEHKLLPLLGGLRAEAAVLELGCGAGNVLELLRRHGFTSATGIDVSEEQVAIAKRRGLPVACAEALAFLRDKEEAYEAVLAIDVLEHLSKQEALELLGLVHRALRPGGRLVIQTLNGEGLFPGQVIYGDLTHMTVLTASSLRHALTLTGFVEARFFETGPVPKNLTGLLRATAWRVIRLGANLVRRIETGKGQELWTENLICVCRRR